MYLVAFHHCVHHYSHLSLSLRVRGQYRQLPLGGRVQPGIRSDPHGHNRQTNTESSSQQNDAQCEDQRLQQSRRVCRAAFYLQLHPVAGVHRHRVGAVQEGAVGQRGVIRRVYVSLWV